MIETHPELVSIGEIARRLDLHRQTIRELASDHPDFPAPYCQVTTPKGLMPAYTWASVVAWDTLRARRPVPDGGVVNISRGGRERRAPRET